MHRLTALLRHRTRTVLVFALLGLALAAALTFSQPLRYSATARLLVIPRGTISLDPDTALRSTERLAGNLAVLVRTTDFFTKVAAQDPNVAWSSFGATAAERRRAWQDAIRTKVEPAGLLAVTALHADQDQAGRIAQAAADVLASRGQEYVGGDVEIKLVDAPLVSNRPVDPNITLNLLLGLFLGILVGLGLGFGGAALKNQ